MRDCARGFDRVNVFEARPKEGCAIDISLLTDERSHVNDNPQMRVDSTEGLTWRKQVLAAVIYPTPRRAL